MNTCLSYSQAKEIAVKMIAKGSVSQKDVDDLFLYRVSGDYQIFFNNSCHNPSIKHLFTLVSLCKNSGLSAGDKVVVIKCLQGFTEKSTKIAYKEIYNYFVKKQGVPENDSK